jgi:hypothetical protein
MKQFMKWVTVIPTVAVAFIHFLSRADSTTNAFGFSGPEIYPIDQQIGLMHVADLDGDGLNDIVVANNLRAKINLLYNLTGKTNRAAANPLQKLELNELPPDSRFRIDSIPANERIAAMDVKDLNGDGRPDIVYYGDQKDLVVLYNLGTNGWSDPKTWHIDDGQMDPNALATGDLTGNGLNDIVLLGDNGAAYFFKQRADHTLAEPEKISYSGTPHAVQIVDVNGDGRNDLLFVDFDSPVPYRVRFQMEGGELGPEIYFKNQPIRSFCIDNLAGGLTNYLTGIVQATGRAEVSQFTRQPSDVLSGTLRAGQFQVLPLNKTAAGQRGVLFQDVDGDGRPDLLVAEPESGQLSVYLQQADGTFGAPRQFPSLAGVSQIAVADWNNDGHPQIFLLSHDENAVGVTAFDSQGHLPFPTKLPLDGKPLIMATGVLKPGGKPVLAVIVDKDGARSLAICTGDGKIKTQKLSAGFTSTPTTLAIQDVNQDGLADLLLMIPYEKIKVLLQKTDGSFDEEDVDPPGGPMDQPWLASADLDGSGKPELLLPQKNFIRAVVLQQQVKIAGSTNPPVWTFSVKDQINGVDSDSLITGATAVKNGNNATPSIFLLDSGHKYLTLTERDQHGVWQVVKNLDLPVSDFASIDTIPIGGSPAVAFLSQNAVAWKSLTGDVWGLSKLDYYDTPIKDGYLNDVVAGDLTGSGRKQLVFMETARNYLDLVFFNRDRKLVPGDRWKVFEQHTFRGADNALPEPRECAVADVTGDGKNDLIVLVHDRILVYPQE